MAPAIEFPDLEVILVEGLRMLLNRVTDPVTEGVYLSTRRAPADFTPNPAKQITIRSDGGSTLDTFLKEERFGINIWAPSYSEASQLASIVATLLPLLPDHFRSTIKGIDVTLSPVRVNEDTEEEQRYLTGSALVGSHPLSITLTP